METALSQSSNRTLVLPTFCPWYGINYIVKTKGYILYIIKPSKEKVVVHVKDKSLEGADTEQCTTGMGKPAQPHGQSTTVHLSHRKSAYRYPAAKFEGHPKPLDTTQRGTCGGY